MVRHNTLKLIITTILQAFQVCCSSVRNDYFLIHLPKSMAYIMLLVFLVFYCYAIVGIYLYKPYTDTSLHVEYRSYFR
jgi:hypothetical protein